MLRHSGVRYDRAVHRSPRAAEDAAQCVPVPSGEIAGRPCMGRRPRSVQDRKPGMIVVFQLSVGLVATLLGFELSQGLERWPWPNRALRQIATLWFVFGVSLVVHLLLLLAAS